MRHKVKSKRLGRSSAHREALVAGLVCHLIERKRITTTLPKAKAASSLAERMVTLGKKALADETRSLTLRRQAVAKLHRKDRVAQLFDEVAPAFTEREGGYTRIVKLGRRASDSSEMAILEWVDLAGAKSKQAASAPDEKPAGKKKGPAKKKSSPKSRGGKDRQD